MAEEIVRRPANVLATADVMGEERFDNAFRMAKALAASHMFKDVTTAEQAFGRILLGADLGLSPTQALMSIDVVEGNVQVRSVRLAAWVRQHDDYDYAVLEHDEQHCVIEIYRRGVAMGTSSFSMEDAANAKLIKEHPKSPWRAHPRNMLFARAMSNAVRWYAPDLTGGIPVYTEADVFDAVSSATEIASGEGDGSEPGWHGIAEDAVAELDELLAWAESTGFPGFSDKATVQMRLSHQPAEAVQEWIDAAKAQRVSVESAETKDGES